MRLSSGCQDSNQTLLLHLFWQPLDSSLYSSCLRLCFAVASFSLGSLILLVWASSRCLTGSRLQLGMNQGAISAGMQWSSCLSGPASIHAMDHPILCVCVVGAGEGGLLIFLFARQVVEREHIILCLQNSQSGQCKPLILQDPRVKATAIRSHNLVMAEPRWESPDPSLGLKVASRVEKQMQMPAWTSGIWGLGDVHGNHPSYHYLKLASCLLCPVAAPCPMMALMGFSLKSCYRAGVIEAHGWTERGRVMKVVSRTPTPESFRVHSRSSVVSSSQYLFSTYYMPYNAANIIFLKRRRSIMSK